MALPSGKTDFVDAMIAADLEFLNAYGGSLDPAAEPRLRTKYEKMHDAITAAITGHAVVLSNSFPFGSFGTIE